MLCICKCMKNGKRTEIINITLVLFVAIIASASTVLEKVDPAFASWLTAYYCIDIFCVVGYFLFMKLDLFKQKNAYSESLQRNLKVVDYILFVNLFLVNVAFIGSTLTALISSYRTPQILYLYGIVIQFNFYFSLILLVFSIVALLTNLLYRIYSYIDNF